jgi:acetylornithine deacetylase/succinyl-diaminopimelate desuccinylase-like protein
MPRWGIRLSYVGVTYRSDQAGAESTAAKVRRLDLSRLPEASDVVDELAEALIGRRAAPPGAPTVLLYAHHDVQPAGDLALWDSDPFQPVESGGRLYGRGAADDKAGMKAHIAALRALGDDLPVGVAVFIDGEKEYGSAATTPSSFIRTVKPAPATTSGPYPARPISTAPSERPAGPPLSIGPGRLGS